MLVSTAFAEAATTSAGQQSILTSIAPLLLIVVIFYFLLIRPQQKRMREHQNALSGITKGSKIITGGGILATVVKVDEKDDLLFVEIAQNTRIKVKRSTVTQVLDSTDTQADKKEENKSVKKPIKKKQKAKDA